jgi:DNA-binding beta-propeller fold protein YncE
VKNLLLRMRGSYVLDRAQPTRVPYPLCLSKGGACFVRLASRVATTFLSFLFFAVMASSLAAQTPSPALLVLEKGDNMLAIVDPATLKIIGRVPAGPDPHEIEASRDGKLAYISNYGGSDSSLHTISVIDLVVQKPLPPIEL